MSDYETSHDADDPRFEPWLGVMLGAFVPLTFVLLSPAQFLIPLVAVAAALFAAGLVMLRRQTLRRARARTARELPSTTPAARSVDARVLDKIGAES